jgi:NADPH-dependent 2,4-dienoyl-CoA reductase/sulfur reductase-like enzyme
VNIPVAVVGGINDPAMAEAIIAEGKADFVALGRQALADPEFANKALTGRADEIAPCQRCGCFSPMAQIEGEIPPPHTFQCAVNPVSSKEYRMSLEPAPKQKRSVLVIGGGPGGMYAAITAAERGHQVTLVEKEASLGGTLKFAEIDHYKSDLNQYKNSLINRVQRLDIDVRLNTMATTELIQEANPDALIVAIGGQPIVPNIPGISNPNVLSALDTHWQPEKVGDKVVIIGGGLVGCDTGLHLAAEGKKVVLVEMMDELAVDATESHRIALFEEMKQHNIEVHTGLRCADIVTDGIHTKDRDDNDQFFAADTVVVAVGMKSLTDEAFRLCDAAPRQYFLIGDCVQPRKVKEAVHEGYHAAMDIF